MRDIDLKIEKKRVIEFILRYMSSAHCSKAIIGISGGLDSAVTAVLTAEALGTRNITGVMMPYKKSNPDSLQDGLALVKELQIDHRIIDITPMVDSWFENYEPDASNLRRGNYMARIRMTVLYDLSAKLNALVIGTGNKSELLSGYTTQYGDNACAFEPIGHLYKTEIRELASMINVPQAILDKQPSADLWQGQTDEAELGISYRLLDEILYLLTDKKLSKAEVVNAGYSVDDIERVVKLYQNSEFKRKMPPSL